MPISSGNMNSLLSDWAALAPYMSVHSAFSATGGNELAGGSYARVPVTWAAPSGESMSLSGTPYSINAPASSVAGWVGFFSSPTGGTFAGMFPGGNASAYAFAVPSSTGVFLAPGSSYSNGTEVVVLPSPGGSLPGGITEGTIYYVISASGDSFELSTSSGGSAVSITADGTGLVQAITTESFSAAGTYTVSGCTVSGT